MKLYGINRSDTSVCRAIHVSLAVETAQAIRLESSRGFRTWTEMPERLWGSVRHLVRLDYRLSETGRAGKEPWE